MLLLKQPYTPPTIAVQPLPYTLHHGDCIAVMRTLPENSIDAIVTDPPAGIHFMNMAFDSDKGGRKQWIAWLTEVMTEALRVMKPGGHAFVWALPRTSHWTATALEDAGFEIRDVITHLFGSGFPKSQDISKAIDRKAGKEREVVGVKYRSQVASEGWDRPWKHRQMDTEASTVAPYDITVPATPDAMRYAGYGTALKPASEHWILCRKPLSEPTIAANVLKHGTGGLNIDASRIAGTVPQVTQGLSTHIYGNGHGLRKESALSQPHTQGRFPSNLLISHTLECQRVGTQKVRTAKHGKPSQGKPKTDGHIFNYGVYNMTDYCDSEGMETIEAWHCSELCPVRLLDEQSGVRKSGGRITQPYETPTIGATSFSRSKDFQMEPSEGGASRYFAAFAPTLDDYPPFYYCSKSSRKERNAGCEGLPEKDTQRVSGIGGPKVTRCPEHDTSFVSGAVQYTCGCPFVYEGGTYARLNSVQNSHPTVKSLSLMKYLCTMITPENGVILDPFMGSGSTGCAAIAQGFQFVGIEQEASYLAIAEARVAHAAMEVYV